jgi:hypothetical protein
MAMQPLALETGIRDGAGGSSRRLRRPALALALAALALAVTGDRSRAAGVPAGVTGQDPLEVLELKVRPNVIVVLDSSGSMTTTQTGGADTRSGDHPVSKMYQAKQVLKQVVANNQDKVSFMFGQYTQDPSRLNNRAAGNDRFQYTTTTMPSPELTVRRASGDRSTSNRGLQSWQIIYPAWGTLYFDEDAATDASCTATLTGLPKFYASGSTLATELAAAMNSASCTGSSRANTYAVTYNTGTGQFSFSRTVTSRPFQIRWDRTPNNIRNALAETSTSFGFSTGTISTDAPWTLLQRQTGTGSSGTGMSTRWTITEPIGGVSTTFYNVRAGRVWNGEVIRVDSNGAVCGMDFASATTQTNPPSFTVQATTGSCNPNGGSAVFTFAGGAHGSTGSCGGFQKRVEIIPCDLQSPPAPLQITTMDPYLANQSLFNADGSMVEYSEVQDGSWTVLTYPAGTTGGARASGSTPLGNSLIDIKAEFTNLWYTGPATGPWAGIPATQRAIMNHQDPKEKTIVLFVTDGNDTCDTRTGALGETDLNALRAAHKAQQLYARIDAAQPASSVQTYVIGYGGAFSGGEPTRLNWIAWGGSGMTGIPTTATGEAERWDPPGCNISYSSTNNTTCVSNYLNPRRATCPTCTDALVAPDADTMAAQLQAIIDQGASDGDFNAQQSITESVFEYVHLAATTVLYDAGRPSLRYKAIVPTRFISSFTLPGFKGQQRAYQNDGSGGTVLAWSAGDVLYNQISSPVSGIGSCPANAGANVGLGECVFDQLHGGASVTDATIRTSTAKIKRRIYTTDRNGVFPYTIDTLIDGTSANRVALWPPAPSLLTGAYDTALGLPPNNPTSFPPNPVDKFCDPLDTRANANPKKPFNQCWFEWLGKKLQACVGSNLPTACTDPSYAVSLPAARQEAREIALAFLAGAATVPDTTGIKRTSGAVGSSPARSLLYKARSWMLGDSELATAAVVTPPLPSEPTATPYLAEYQLFRDGPRAGGTNPGRAGTENQVKMGFGLRNPDNDGTVATGAVDTNVGLKPVMTVLYAPANDMLHAFRSGPCDTPALNVPCDELGGEELWGFLPYDQLHTILLRAAHEPQGKNNHVYSLARGVRFSDVFVPGSYSRSVGTGTVSSAQGAWRRIMFIGRGIGGKYMTALDVTGPGPYTEYALATTPPIPLWSRGNPDTQDGLAGGTRNGSNADATAYSRMGETWSIPVVAYVDKTNPIYNGLDYVLYMGSGYSSTAGEGTTFYTLDALSGDVVATADVGSRLGMSYPNALVANPVGFNPEVFNPLTTVHPAAAQVTRVYIGDVHGRLWKFLAARPDVALPVADLGADQPVGAAASLLGMPPQPGVPVPYIYVSSGADRRATGPFQMFAFRDTGGDTDTAIGAGSTTCVTGATQCNGGPVTTYMPVERLFTRFYDQGDPPPGCTNLTAEAVFRGTIQPATAFECGSISVGSCTTPIGRAFFGGTRLSLPNTKFAPITPLLCGGSGTYPCRSQFDSTIYALGALSGEPAYDLNASTDDAYRIFRDSRIAAITVQADPDPGRGGSSFTPDEGLMKGIPKPPPPPGVPPTATTATANVVMVREPGQPAPAIRYGSTVCQ